MSAIISALFFAKDIIINIISNIIKKSSMKNIFIIIIIIICFLLSWYLYIKYDIIEKSSLDILTNKVEKYENLISTKDIEINNYKVDIKSLESKLKACYFKQEIDKEAKKAEENDYEMANIDPNSNKLPF